MPNLNVSTGVKEFLINDNPNAKITLNPTDFSFVSTLFSEFSELEKKDKVWREEMQTLTEPFDILAKYAEGDRVIRETLDRILGEGICSAVFGSMNVLALSDGLPVWMNLVLAIIDECDAAFVSEQKKQNPKLQKYISKYHR